MYKMCVRRILYSEQEQRQSEAEKNVCCAKETSTAELRRKTCFG